MGHRRLWRKAPSSREVTILTVPVISDGPRTRAARAARERARVRAGIGQRNFAHGWSKAVGNPVQNAQQGPSKA